MDLYFSVTEKYMNTWWGGGPKYIPQLRVTDKYIPIYSSVRCN
jgi:hypothetical protein